jgi:hypothetical protein
MKIDVKTETKCHIVQTISFFISHRLMQLNIRDPTKINKK